MTDQEAFNIVYGIVQAQVMIYGGNQEQAHEAMETLKSAIEFKKEMLKIAKHYGGTK